jgi:hypothetical protein
LALDDEKRVISTLITGFIRQIQFGKDFEQQLSFYVEARASFTNLDMVLVHLIQVSQWTESSTNLDMVLVHLIQISRSRFVGSGTVQSSV